MTHVQVMPDISWLEADWVQDLTITGNTVVARYGGIFVGLLRPNNLGSGTFLNHANISITGMPRPAVPCMAEYCKPSPG